MESAQDDGSKEITESCNNDDHFEEEIEEEDYIVGALEAEAKLRAVKHITGLLRRSEQLEKVLIH